MKRYLYLTVFISGMTTLGIEFAASRLLGSVFGTSNLVWAAIIGLILIYLTVGYSLGGRWADKNPNNKTFYTILIWGAFSAGIVPFIARPVLFAAADAFDQLQIGVLFHIFFHVINGASPESPVFGSLFKIFLFRQSLHLIGSGLYPVIDPHGRKMNPIPYLLPGERQNSIPGVDI